MTLATRCPWCETVFSLSKEQAAARAGMVRCGICKHTFNALDYLVRGSELGVHADRLLNSVSARSLEPAPDPEPAPPAKSARPAAAPARTARPSTKPPARDPEDREPTLGILADQEDTLPEPSTTDSASGLVEPSFLRSARGDEPEGMSRGKFIAWSLLALIALLGLGAQAAYQWRGDVLQRIPQLEAEVHQLCATLGCTLAPPGDIDLLTIESSSLEPEPSRPDVVVFTSLLRSHSPVTEQLPAFELTFTDSQDHPTVRRVLLPRDYLSTQQHNLADTGLAANSELPVKVTLEINNADVVGYQIKLFYP